MNDAGLGDARREERVLQLLRMLNNYLNKHKETSKRFLNFTVPRVVAVSPQMRLVEDNPSSATLLDIYRLRCVKRNIEHDMPIAKYYERLATIQARGSQVSSLPYSILMVKFFKLFFVNRLATKFYEIFTKTYSRLWFHELCCVNGPTSRSRQPHFIGHSAKC